MNNLPAEVTKHAVINAKEWNDKERDMLKRQWNINDDELDYFGKVCKHTNLDPWLKQICAVKRWNSKTGREEMTIQTTVDGYRLIASRTGKYAPGPEPSFQLDKAGNIISATSSVMLLVKDKWFEVRATAYWDEYKQMFKDKKTKQWRLGTFWQKMPRVMISKCSESICLRKAFPAELSGLYTREEMSADEEDSRPVNTSINKRIEIAPRIAPNGSQGTTIPSRPKKSPVERKNQAKNPPIGKKSEQTLTDTDTNQPKFDKPSEEEMIEAEIIANQENETVTRGGGNSESEPPFLDDLFGKRSKKFIKNLQKTVGECTYRELASEREGVNYMKWALEEHPADDIKSNCAIVLEWLGEDI